MDRVGRALVSPRAAFEAADRGEGGASDALLLLLLKFLCTETRSIVIALWATLVNGPGVGLPRLLGRLSGAVSTDLVFILVAGVTITIAAGRRRAPARDFDLATVAWIPVLLVATAAALVQTAFGVALPATAVYAVTGVALAWMAVWVVLAVRVARGRAATPSEAGA